MIVFRRVAVKKCRIVEIVARRVVERKIEKL